MRAQFMRFALVGVVGFLVDAATLYIAMRYGEAGHYTGRILSYLTAATSTWALNRRYTFTTQRDSNLFREWLKFLAANAVGGLINYAVYAALVTFSSLVATLPAIGVAAGSVAGLAVNFTLSRRVVFTAGRTQK